MKMILCTDLNGNIGYQNKLLFDIPEDMKYFKEKTSGEGNVVVMGRKTFDSLPFKDGLPNRFRNFVITNQKRDDTRNVSYIKCTDIDTVIYGIDYVADVFNVDVWVIGGATIYEQLIDYVDEIHWTVVQEVSDKADTKVDINSLFEGFEEVSCEALSESPHKSLIRVLVRKDSCNSIG